MDGAKTNTFIEAFTNPNPEGRHQALAKIVGNLVDNNIDYNNCLPIVTAWNYTLTEPMTTERLEKDLRGLYRSFWNRRPDSKNEGRESLRRTDKNVEVDSRSTPAQIIKPKLEDILV